MSLSRRELLKGSTAEETCHIASMVVQCLPQKLAATAAALEAIDDLEVPERDERGKLVVLIEAVSEATLMQRITQIENTAGVISANMVYHQLD
ncbi:MAG: chaperone NapD [Halieaceae bacterium]